MTRNMRLALLLASGLKSSDSSHWVGAFRENPLGQNDNCSDEVTFDCLVDAMTGKFHISYCTDAERLKA